MITKKVNEVLREIKLLMLQKSVRKNNNGIFLYSIEKNSNFAP